MRLIGKVAIITGAASGIGFESAQLFLREGANVLAVDLPSSRLGDYHHKSSNLEILEKDITDRDAPDKIIRKGIQVFGKLDILFNNAGISFNSLAEQQTDEEWSQTIDVNLTSQFKLVRASIPFLKESENARIINTASVMTRMTDYGLVGYCASKAGVAGMTRSLAWELGKYGITVNYIEPGAIYTGLTKQNFDDKMIANVWARKAALRRLGQPIDVARAALFLASEDSSFVTGHGLTVDGGLTLRT